MGQCISSTRHEGLKKGETSKQSYILQILNSKADRKPSIRSTRESGDGELSTTSTYTRKSGDGELSLTSTRRSVDGKLSTTSTRNSTYGKLSSTSTRKSVDGRPSSTSTRTFGEEGAPTASTWTYVHGKLLGMLSSISETRKSVCLLKPSPTSTRTSVQGTPGSTTSTRRSVEGRPGSSTSIQKSLQDLKPSPISTRKSLQGTPGSTTSARRSVEGTPGSSTSIRKSVDLRPSPISTRKSIQGTPGSTTATRRSVDRKPFPTPTRQSAQGKPDSTTSTRKSADRKRSTAIRQKSFGSKATKERVAESVSGWFSALSDDSKLFRGLRRHKEEVSSTEPTKLGWYSVRETERDSLDHGNSRSRDSLETRSPAISSSKRDGHPRSSLRYQSVERRSVETKPAGNHGNAKTRSRDRRSKSIDTISVDTKSTERKSIEWQWIDSELSVEGFKPTERRWVDRKVVESTIDDEMDLEGKSSLDIIRGFSSADENSNGFKAIKSRNQYFTRSGSSPAGLTYLPEFRESPGPDDFDFLAQRFAIDKHEKTSPALVNGRSVLAGQSDRTDTQAPRESPSAQESLDKIRKSYRKSASRAASLDLKSFKSMAKTTAATS